MNSELSSTDILEHLASSAALPNLAPVEMPLEMPMQGDRQCDDDDNLASDDMDADGEDSALSRAPTLLINNMLPSQSEATVLEEPKGLSKYVQGVVQGQQAYIITNLFGESQILYQPQMVWTIGRNRDAALPLQDRSMSRRHAVLLYVQDVGFQLIDLNSMNGSFVNGERIQQRQPLQDGDRIRIGCIHFRFFVTNAVRSLEPIHPEVLARFNVSENNPSTFMDYDATLDEPKVIYGKGNILYGKGDIRREE